MLYYNTIASFNNQKSVEKLRKFLKFSDFLLRFPCHLSPAPQTEKNSAIVDD